MTPTQIRTEIKSLEHHCGHRAVVMVAMHSHHQEGAAVITICRLSQMNRVVEVRSNDWRELFDGAKQAYDAEFRMIECKKEEGA